MLEAIFFILFVISAMVLVAVILLQEGKGGGLSDAFGGAGAETFGVRSGGINKFTFGVFAVFVITAMLIHMTSDRDPNAGSILGTAGGTAAPLPGTPGGAPVVPGGAGSTSDNPIQITPEQLEQLGGTGG